MKKKPSDLACRMAGTEVQKQSRLAIRRGDMLLSPCCLVGIMRPNRINPGSRSYRATKGLPCVPCPSCGGQVKVPLDA